MRTTKIYELQPQTLEHFGFARQQTVNQPTKKKLLTIISGM
jgi:hypothetical protein